MLSILIKGFLIGVCVSAPVGPIGVLCIQRTLSRGKLHGLATGFGAACSDIIYALIALFSLGFVLDFIDTHQFFIQIAGSLILLFFGIYIFKSRPVLERFSHTSKHPTSSLLRDFVTSFALCFSNPLILFLFLGLFAKFSFFTSEDTFLQIFLGIILILCGALMWWYTLSSIVDIFRKKVTLRGLVLVNKITGSAIILLSLFGLIGTLIKNFS